MRKGYGIIGLALIIILVFGLWRDYQDFSRAQKISSDLESQKLQIQELRQTLDSLFSSNSELAQSLALQLAEQQKALEESEAELSKQLSLIEINVSSQQEELLSQDISLLAREWEKRVAKIECDFRDNSGDVFQSSSGSAVALYRNSGLAFVTNAHVVQDDDTNIVASDCVITAQSQGQEFEISKTDITFEDDKDIAYIQTGAYLLQGVITPLQSCTQDPSIGDALIILGYPSVGSKSGVTLTNGIISGFEDDYYITNAKIDKGNSGGAAVSVKNNCFLGIPTLAKVGKVESFARILPF